MTSYVSLHKFREVCTSLLLIIMSSFLTSSCSKKTLSILDSNRILELEITNKKYEHLSLFTSIKSSIGKNGLEFPGKSVNGYKWTFTIPDSINEVSEGYGVRIQPFDFAKNEDRAFSFSAEKISDKKVSGFYLKNKVTSLKGKYVSQDSIQYTDLGYLLVDTFAMSPTVICDVINLELIDKIHQSDLEIILSYPYFKKINSYTFNERLKIIRKYPYSDYLLQALPSLTKSLDKNELNQLFNAFTNEMKHSVQGQNVYNSINLTIQPITVDTLNLINSKDGALEAVISTYSKYTLIIFSASWCAPCHKQIPLLKDIFNDCKSSLDMVYISVDRKEEEENWNKLMEKEQIPWRSLFARDYRKGLYKRYSIDGIPYSLLVYPNGKMEAIDVRIKADRDKLYKLLANNAL